MNNKLDLSNVYTEINLLKEKIALLEKDNYIINKILEKEIQKNKNIGNNLISTDIIILKKRQDQFEGAMIRDFSKFKNEIINNINNSNSDLLQNVENLLSQYNINNENKDINISQEIE